MKNFIFSFILLFLFTSSYSQSKGFSEEPKKPAKEQIQQLRERVINGESIKKIAVLYSEDPGSASKGGLYQNIGKGVMPAEFEKAAFSLKEGEISEVFETTYGYHFIQLIKRHEDLVDVMHVLIVPKVKK